MRPERHRPAIAIGGGVMDSKSDDLKLRRSENGQGGVLKEDDASVRSFQGSRLKPAGPALATRKAAIFAGIERKARSSLDNHDDRPHVTTVDRRPDDLAFAE
jgi:hypothetical protein